MPKPSKRPTLPTITERNAPAFYAEHFPGVPLVPCADGPRAGLRYPGAHGVYVLAFQAEGKPPFIQIEGRRGGKRLTVEQIEATVLRVAKEYPETFEGMYVYEDGDGIAQYRFQPSPTYKGAVACLRI